MVKKRKPRDEIWNTNIGIMKKIPRSKLKYSLSLKDVFRLLFLFLVFSIPFIFWIDLTTGLALGLFLLFLFEFSGIKMQGGLLEIVGTGETLPLLNEGMWENLHKFFGYWLIISIILSLINVVDFLF